MNWLRRFSAPPAPQTPDHSAERIAALEARCGDLEERLRRSDERLRERSELLYELQQHYSSEHFSLRESMHDLNIERLRNAGAFAGFEIVLRRAKDLQERIRALKERLKKYEAVEEQLFDTAPIVAETEQGSLSE